MKGKTTFRIELLGKSITTKRVSDALLCLLVEKLGSIEEKLEEIRCNQIDIEDEIMKLGKK